MDFKKEKLHIDAKIKKKLKTECQINQNFSNIAFTEELSC